MSMPGFGIFYKAVLDLSRGQRSITPISLSKILSKIQKSLERDQNLISSSLGIYKCPCQVLWNSIKRFSTYRANAVRLRTDILIQTTCRGKLSRGVVAFLSVQDLHLASRISHPKFSSDRRIKFWYKRLVKFFLSVLVALHLQNLLNSLSIVHLIQNMAKTLYEFQGRIQGLMEEVGFHQRK